MSTSLMPRKHQAAKTASRKRRQVRGRKKIFGYPERPRLVVTRSARHIFVQVIDDVKGHTLACASTMEADVRALEANKTEQAAKVGELIAQRALAAGIDKVVFDRAGNQYHGRVAAVADAARKAGLGL